MISFTLSFQLGAQSAFTLENFNTSNSPLQHNTIRDLVRDDNGNLWLATDNGLYKKTGANWTVFNMENTNFPSNAIRSIAFDAQVNPAIGFFDHGLMIFDGENWIHYDVNNSPLPDNFVKNLSYDLNGALWISTTGGLVKKMNNDWTMWDSYNSIAWTNNFTKVRVDPNNNNKYVGSINGGFLVFVDDTLQSVEISYTNSIADNTIHDILIRPNGDIWCASPSGGLQMRFGYNIWAWFNTENSSIPSSSFNALTGSDVVYLSSHNQGVVVMTDDVFTTINMNNSNLPTNYIVNIALDENESVLWIATNSHGLFKLDLKTVSLPTQNITKKQIFPNPFEGTIQLGKTANHVVVRNAIGQIVAEFSNLQSSEINLEHLNSGLYWLEIDGDAPQKIVKR
jgi:ligand-binding sensor domain-containing protein